MRNYTVSYRLRKGDEELFFPSERAAGEHLGKPMNNSVIIDAVRAALEKGGQHILIAPDGGVSIWPDTAEPVVRCKDCKWYDTESGTLEGKDGFCPHLGCCSEADWFCADGEREDGA